MAITKEQILSEIKRTAQANSGVPLGWRKFANETGIRNPDWLGKFWARWSDALHEAGFKPNAMTQPHGEQELLEKFAALSLSLGHLPAVADIRLQITNGLEFPDWNTFTRQFGGKPKMVESLREFCQSRPAYAAVVAMCDKYVPRRRGDAGDSTSDEVDEGFVYLIQHGTRREFKIGRTNNALRREGEIGVELPEKVKPIHVIKTDDAAGIESYWHRRFADKRKNGEWFVLSAADVTAFRRRKFM